MNATLRTHVRLDTVDGSLVGSCEACEVVLRQRHDFDRDIAVGTFLQHHPESPLAVHRLGTPAGWSSTVAA